MTAKTEQVRPLTEVIERPKFTVKVQRRGRLDWMAIVKWGDYDDKWVYAMTERNLRRKIRGVVRGHYKLFFVDSLEMQS